MRKVLIHCALHRRTRPTTVISYIARIVFLPFTVARQQRGSLRSGELLHTEGGSDEAVGDAIDLMVREETGSQRGAVVFVDAIASSEEGSSDAYRAYMLDCAVLTVIYTFSRL